MLNALAYRNSFPLAQPEDAHWTDRVVTEGHAQYCREYGHATWTENGVTRTFCPRCGDAVTVPESTPREGDRVSTPDGEGTFVGVTGSLYAVHLPHKGHDDVRGFMPQDVTLSPRTDSILVGLTSIDGE